MKTVFIFIGFLLLAGCGDYKSTALGPEARIVVFADTSTISLVNNGLQLSISKQINTLPQPQPLFDIELHKPFDFINLRNRAYLLFLASLSDTGATSKLVKQMLSKEVYAKAVSGEQNIFVVRNQWNDRQLSVFIVADSLKNLDRILATNAETISYTFLEFTLGRTYYQMFKSHSQPEKSDQVLNKLGFTVDFQHDYVIVKDTLNPNFFYMKRVQADVDRWLWVYWWDEKNPDFSDQTRFLRIRDSITKMYVQGDDSLGSYVEIAKNSKSIPMYLEQKTVDFKGMYAIETRGLWRLTDYSMGGPFINYTFYNDSLKQMYMIDGSVLAPKFSEKRDFLREMEVIAKTIRWKKE